MDLRVWDAIDEIATREAQALREARKQRLHRSARGSKGSKNCITRDQAIWDEGLVPHYTHCSFCGRELHGQQDELGRVQVVRGERVSLFTQDVDICNDCMYLHKQLVRSCPIRSVPD